MNRLVSGSRPVELHWTTNQVIEGLVRILPPNKRSRLAYKTLVRRAMIFLPQSVNQLVNTRGSRLLELHGATGTVAV